VRKDTERDYFMSSRRRRIRNYRSCDLGALAPGLRDRSPRSASTRHVGRKGNGQTDRFNEQLLCSFCGKSQRQVKKLIAGPGVYICDECIDCAMRSSTRSSQRRPRLIWRTCQAA